MDQSAVCVRFTRDCLTGSSRWRKEASEMIYISLTGLCVVQGNQNQSTLYQVYFVIEFTELPLVLQLDLCSRYVKYHHTRNFIHRQSPPLYSRASRWAKDRRQYSGSTPASITVYGAARSYGDHMQGFKALEIIYKKAMQGIDVTLFEERQGSSIQLCRRLARTRRTTSRLSMRVSFTLSQLQLS